MEFEWDPKKADANLQKHDVDFADAVGVLYDELAITIEDEAWEEERYVTLGMDALSRLLVVAYAWRGDRVRVNEEATRDRNEEGIRLQQR